MFTAHLHQTMNLTAGQFIAGLTDFGPGRSELFSNSKDDRLEVHNEGQNQADVTEGSSSVWETLHYDWSNPNKVVLTTTDSNTWGGHSGFTYTFKPQVNGKTDVDVDVVREGKNLKGKALAAALSLGGKRVLAKNFENTIKAVEARSQREPL